jgi:hypothetical protein
MYLLGERLYDPAVGRFVGRDSAAFLDPSAPGGLNLYAYCHNDPIGYADHTGHFPILLGLLFLGFGIGAAIGAGASVVTQGLTNGWENINGWQVLLDSVIGGISGMLSFSGIGALGMALASGALGFVGSVGGDLIASNGNWSKINWGKAAAMGGINFFLGYCAGAGVQNRKEIGETLAKVSASYRAILDATKRGIESGTQNAWNVYGGRLMTDIALAMPSIISGRMFKATSTMATTAIAMTLFNWGADFYFDWW